MHMLGVLWRLEHKKVNTFDAMRTERLTHQLEILSHLADYIWTRHPKWVEALHLLRLTRRIQEDASGNHIS